MDIKINGKSQALSDPQDQLTRAVIISLFTWRRKNPDDDYPAVMGWWGDSFPNVENDRIGSRLYLLNRQKVTNQTANLARGYIREALEWMIEDGVCVGNEITVTRTDLQTLATTIVIFQQDGNRHSLEFANIWEALT